ncbi:hypothetical protein E2562_017450 [Oryza meyeriana var. granulata]|uniref:Uncharacterized protein n=1 Tax=Oryza meyeriana var. granulata TaxID=110450 RepID=A0A6G1DXY4_9ORYZ|nr:hypothetical protein E2562_017450 [Oryza meyeriana var. granulata]
MIRALASLDRATQAVTCHHAAPSPAPLPFALLPPELNIGNPAEGKDGGGRDLASSSFRRA